MKGFLEGITVVLLATVMMAAIPTEAEGKIYEDTVRLHILAHSDSEEDQALKLKVRDAILGETADLLSNCREKDEAIAVAKQNIEVIRAAALGVIEDEGYSYSVDIEIGEEEYPTKNYESFCFPAGSYASLRVKIGEAEGQNWWCVLYPPLCLSAATEKREVEEEFISVGLTDEQYGIITETEDAKYQLRFKFLEVFGNIGR